MTIPLAKKTRAAVVQAAPVVWDRKRSVEKLAEFAADAARQRADVVLFPEGFISGYPVGLDFGARFGMRSAEGREDFRRFGKVRWIFPAQLLSGWASAHRCSATVI